ncbi:MAG: hypothetical protein HW385_595, partial [candidate division NC10 bacterium]|nr:hypothetical protein [candidate division NC10 bacterium]
MADPGPGVVVFVRLESRPPRH